MAWHVLGYNLRLSYFGEMAAMRAKFSAVAVAAAIAICLPDAVYAESVDAQVLPHLASHRSRMNNPEPADKVLIGNSSDPFSGYNRAVWAFNYDFLDKYALRPVAHGYADYVPAPLRTGVHNFLQNIGEVNNAVNNLAVGEVKSSGQSVVRFVINSTFGLFGFFDIAQHMGLERKPMTFSTVLGKWHVANGPYIQLPFTGYTTPRTLAGSVVDTLYFPYNYVSWPVALGYFALNVIDARSSLGETEKLIDKSLDPYLTARDFFLQHEETLVVGKERMDAIQREKDEKQNAELESYLDEID